MVKISDETRTGVFFTIVIFLSLITLFSNYFGINTLNMPVSCLKPKAPCTITEQSDNWWENAYNTAVSTYLSILNTMPVTSLFVPIARIILFQFSSGINPFVTIFLDALLIMLGYIIYEMVRG